MSNQTTLCTTCRGEGKILMIWDRGPGNPPGNGYMGCPECAAGKAYDAAEKSEMDAALEEFRCNWPAGVQWP